jgi:hypothetical protein
MTGDLSMLAATLQQLHADGHLDVRAASLATDVAPSSLYRWISGDSDPQATLLARLFRGGTEQVQSGLLSWLTAGTGWVCTIVPGELDCNGDGDVNIEDAYDATVSAIEKAAALLRAERQAVLDGKVSPLEEVRINETIARAVQQLAVARAVIQFVAASEARRRKCRAPLVTGTSH